MSVHDTPFYSNSQAVHHESVGNTYKNPNLVEHSLQDMEVNPTPVPITKPESDPYTQGPPIAIKAAQNPIKPSGNVNNLAKENFQHSDSVASSPIKYERIPRKLTNRKERTKETPVALQALHAMPKMIPKSYNQPIITGSPAIAVGPRFVYTPPNKPPAPSLLDAAKAAGSNIAQAPNSPASPQPEEKREYVQRKLPRMPKPNVPQKTISAAPSTSSTQVPNSPASLQTELNKPNERRSAMTEEEKMVQGKQPSDKTKAATKANADSKPASTTAPAKKTVQKPAPSVKKWAHEFQLKQFNEIIEDKAKFELLKKYTEKHFVSDDLDFLLLVNKFKENNKMSNAEKTILANEILNYIFEDKINVPFNIKDAYNFEKNILQNSLKDNFALVMDHVVGNFMLDHKLHFEQFCKENQK